MITRLGDLDIEFTSGQIQSRVEFKGEGDALKKIDSIVPKAIENGYLNHESLSSFNVKKDVEKIKVSNVGDIILKLSTPYDACIIEPGDEDLFIPSFCMVLRINDKNIDPYFLLSFINSKSFFNQVKQTSVGSVSNIINIAKVKDVRIPLLPYDEQVKIGDRYKKTIEKIKTMKDIISLEHEYYDTYFLERENY